MTSIIVHLFVLIECYSTQSDSMSDATSSLQFSSDSETLTTGSRTILLEAERLQNQEIDSVVRRFSPMQHRRSPMQARQSPGQVEFKYENKKIKNNSFPAV